MGFMETWIQMFRNFRSCQRRFYENLLLELNEESCSMTTVQPSRVILGEMTPTGRQKTGNYRSEKWWGCIEIPIPGTSLCTIFSDRLFPVFYRQVSCFTLVCLRETGRLTDEFASNPNRTHFSQRRFASTTALEQQLNWHFFLSHQHMPFTPSILLLTGDTLPQLA